MAAFNSIHDRLELLVERATSASRNNKDTSELALLLKDFIMLIKELDIEVQLIKEKTDLFTLDENDNLVIERHLQKE